MSVYLTFLTWTQWRHVRHSMYGSRGEHFWTAQETHQTDWETVHAKMAACPSVNFEFEDFDGERLWARTHIEEREWRCGEGWFKWLSIFRRPKIGRFLHIAFSGETGNCKGSLKGGSVWAAIAMKPGEKHESAFRRYCTEHGMKFVETDIVR